MIKVAMLDDGLSSSNIVIDCKYYEYIVNNNKVYNFCSRSGNSNSHGTICGKIITQASPKSIELYSYKIMNKNQKGSLSDLITGFEHAISTNINIIHLSVGTCDINDFLEIKRLIDMAESKNIFVIAAISNENQITYPASCKYVLGVSHNIRALVKNMIYYEYSKIGADISVCSPQYVMDYNGNKFMLPYCNSFAAAYATSIVIEILENPINDNIKTMQDLKKYLKQHSSVCDYII